jgi:hypothetical protein
MVPLACVILLSAAIVLLDLTEFLQPRNAGTLHRVRNFFGSIAVREREPGDALAHNFVLRHGAITHGLQFAHSQRRRQPTTYFGPASGIGRTIDYYKARATQSDRMRIGVVGLGVGTLAAYIEQGESISFYELNPAVVEIAEDSRWFTYLKDCRQRGGQIGIKLGDARLSLARGLRASEPGSYHLLVLDAFSGDSIPMHLLTIEAFEIYLAHLSPTDRRTPTDAADDENDGAVAVHISNRFIDLEPVLRGVAERFGLKLIRIHNKANRAEAIYSADWIIVSRNEELMRELSTFASRQSATVMPNIIWTDKQSSLIDVLK